MFLCFSNHSTPTPFFFLVSFYLFIIIICLIALENQLLLQLQIFFKLIFFYFKRVGFFFSDPLLLIFFSCLFSFHLNEITQILNMRSWSYSSWTFFLSLNLKAPVGQLEFRRGKLRTKEIMMTNAICRSNEAT